MIGQTVSRERGCPWTPHRCKNNAYIVHSVAQKSPTETKISKHKVESDTSRSETLAPSQQTATGFWGVVASSQSFLSQVIGHFSLWPVAQMQQEQAEKMLREASDIEKEKQLNSAPVNIKPYLSPVGIWETKQCRILCHLCSLTYKPRKVTNNFLQQCHNMGLVASSWASRATPYNVTSTADEAIEEADGMALSPDQVQQIYNMGRVGREEQPLQPTTSSSSLVASKKAGSVSPADLVSSKLSEAYAAASGAAAAAASPIASAAGSFYAGLTSLPLPSLGGSSSSSSGSSNSSVGQEVSKRSTIPVATALILSSKVLKASTSKEEASRTAATSSESTSLATTSVSSASCPSEWFVCDDPVRNLRIFVIQGSDTLDHWKLNLTFDPVLFEDPDFNVTVHRGVYEAAQALYNTFLPMVKEHLASSPFAQVTFTGHSIGGSMGTLLLFMFKRRGIITARQVSTVYTFGAPSVFCEDTKMCGKDNNTFNKDNQPSSSSPTSAGSLPQGATAANLPHSSTLPASSLTEEAKLPSMTQGHQGGPSRLMAALGLRDQIVRNVMMHCDIVPRAFTCDYSPVSDILKGWGPGFKEHRPLNYDERKHLYSYMGRMIILQPDRSWLNFVNQEPDHPMLPPGPGLYYVADPAEMNLPPSKATGRLNISASSELSTACLSIEQQQSANHSQESSTGPNKDSNALPPAQLSQSHNSLSPSPTPSSSSSSSAPRGRVGSTAHGRVPGSVFEAVMEIMDCPHPLEILADPSAYLDRGSISRYHNPDNYTMALGRIIHLERLTEGSRVGANRSSAAALKMDSVLGKRKEAESANRNQWEGSEGGEESIHLLKPEDADF
ncbi:hypothetical protein CEUSTIGMA_g2860.t1 [Chlamydomonas eustigma]|uniref:Fungal lipase-type domain-containing protein n=1 Tax=Chlamydomonas eustigma TaxID=1157962 RepID=A0A250WXA3_9CHLO|nr:hypothetical protein CEUSTIGMA_g2860.t1 [Chlamydomonas eustigma]|eukprot:GAX75416.1 hypothetical protein CEUSTIGMA_g2860.t1 [Chlamydomonas eustigma]